MPNLLEKYFFEQKRYRIEGLKAEALNNQFESVFSEQGSTPLPNNGQKAILTYLKTKDFC